MRGHIPLLRTALVAGAVAVVRPSILAAQFPACGAKATPSTSVLGRGSAELPVDRLADLLALEPGVTSLDRGDLSLRGAGPGSLALYLDGVPVTPGRRGGSALAGGSYFGTTGTGIGIGTNGFTRLVLNKGVAPAELGNARGGILSILTTGDCATDSVPGPDLRGGWATDAIFGNTNGLGFNRLTLDGVRRIGRATFGGAAVLEGQKSARLGLDQNASPVYLADGVDTTVLVNTGAGVTQVDVLRFAPSPGIRIPSSATSSYTLAGRVGVDLGRGQELRVAGYASQEQDRVFDYENLYDPRMLRADRNWSRALTGSWFGTLRRSGQLALHGEAHLSWQTDRAIAGPLSTSGEADTRNPFGGFMLAPVGFRFDFGNFAVNDELVNDFRTGSGRLTPYDLSNTTQYQPIDQYRNNAYGVTGFTESGGPVGTLTLSRENRLVGKGALDARLGERHHARIGFEFTRYDLNFYTSGLTSLSGADAYVESPSRFALFGDYDLRVQGLSVSAGLRYDHFRTGARRPVFPRIFSDPGFDPADPAAGLVADQGHSRVSPRLAASFVATPQLTVSAGFASVAQQPDFAQALAGINTDLSVTSPQQVFGTDLGFERATLANLGAHYDINPATVAEVDIWTRQDHDVVGVELGSEFDPLRGQPEDVLRYRNSADPKATGVDVRLARRLGTRGQAWLGYGYADATTRNASPPSGTGSVPAAYSRPHTLTGALLYHTGPDLAVLAGVLRNVGVYGALRVASGTPYTRCPASVPEDNDLLSGSLCSRFIQGELNGSRLPALKLVDLRVSRGFHLGATELVAFADARNLLNSRNVIRVFSQTGTTSNPASLNRNRSADLAEFANEASANGVVAPSGDIDLSFGGAADPRASCGGWISPSGVNATPNCVYLIGAESRFGNGDHLFTVAEQTRASDARYYVDRGLQSFTGSGRRVRLGLELRF